MRPVTDSQKIIVIWLIRLLVCAALLLVTAIELVHIYPFVGVLVGVCSLSLTAIWGCWYIPAYFRRYSAALTDEAVLITHGVVSVKKTAIPLKYVLAVSISATPLMRLFGIRIVTLGLPSHRVVLHGVRRQDVDALVALCGGKEAAE